MPRRVTIVMYHYVRDTRRAHFPRLKALDVAAFRGQLAYLQRHYTLITPQQLLDAVQAGAALPPRAALLTFDDGYLDHFTTVFPILDAARVTACFFPAARAVLDGRLLDVNKIQLVLATCDDLPGLAAEVVRRIDAERDRYGLPPTAELFAQLSGMSRFDTPEITFVKRALQRGLPPGLRATIVDELFRRYVSEDEAEVAGEMYADRDQLRCMARHGMYVGSHGDSHEWLDILDSDGQLREIERGLELMREVGTPTDGWIMCYPYGGWNAGLLEQLRAHRCAAGLAVDVRIADIDRDDPLLLPRVDTNDLPKRADAEPGELTREAAGPAR